MARRLKSRFLLWGLVFCQFAYCQDIHFSQFFSTPITQGPALTGVFAGDTRAGILFRDQWQSVPVPFRSFSAYVDQQYQPTWLGNGRLGAGLALTQDRSGDGRLNWSLVGARLSYSRELTPEWLLTAGLGFDVGSRSFDPTLLQFADQYNGEFFDPSDPSNEALGRASAGFLSLATGLGAYYQGRNTRTQLWAGIAWQHLNQPVLTFFDGGQVRWPQTYRLYAFGDLEVGDAIDLAGWLQLQTQGPYREYLLGSGVRYHLPRPDDQPPLSLLLGLGYRWADAVIGYAEARYQNWQLGLSYDINTSPFVVATNRRGGPELSLRYLIFRVKPPEQFKSCPVF